MDINKQLNNRDNANQQQESTKKFNPTITLNKLTIKLRDYDGNEIISNDSDEIISNLSLSFNIKVLTKNFTSNLI
mgnify:CR=1 FL=1